MELTGLPGDVEAEEELWLSGASTTTVASSGTRRSTTQPTGWRERERLVSAIDWERRGSEGGAPRKGRRAAMLAKSQWMMGPRCSGELRECHLRKACVTLVAQV
jgi:hypothetical protein